MKRAARRWLEASAGCDHVRYNCEEANCAGTLASNALDSDARQRAEIRGLKKRLKILGLYVSGAWATGATVSLELVDMADLKKPLKETKR